MDSWKLRESQRISSSPGSRSDRATWRVPRRRWQSPAMPEPSTVVSAAKAAAAATRFQPWATVKRHDRLIRQECEDLITWARDDTQKEATALDDVKEDMNQRNLLYSGAYGKELRRVRDEFARRWRDRKRATDRKLAEIEEAEGGCRARLSETLAPATAGEPGC